MGGSSYRACFSFHSSYSEIRDFLTYIRPVHIFPNVVPLGRTVTEVSELLNLMCRKHSGEAEVVYKPLGKLKRARMESVSHGSDSDDELFGEISVAPMRKKLPVNENKKHHSLEKSHDEVTESPILPQLQTSAQTSNYMECTESNDDDDDEEGDGKEKDKLPAYQLSGVTNPTLSCLVMSPPDSKPTPPSWDSFFTAKPVVSDDSELENSQKSQTLSNDHAALQSPELFHDDDDDDTDEFESGHVTSSQSTYVSELVFESLNQFDTMPVQCKKINTEKGFHPSSDEQHDLTDHTEPVSDSQLSSDFDLPMTPGSKAPHPEELKELYKKLAAGENITSNNH